MKENQDNSVDSLDLNPLVQAPDEPEVTAEDLIPEDIDDEIEELPLDEAKELYNIDLFIGEAHPGATPLKDKDGNEVHFENREDAEKAFNKIPSDIRDQYTIHETRSLKPVEDPTAI